MSDVKDALIGFDVVGVELKDDGTEITFLGRRQSEKQQQQPRITLFTHGDCCSSTWIESIDDSEALFGKILDVEEIDMPKQVQKMTPLCPYPDSVAFYGLRITTEKGRAVIEYRNNSNGYYGGSLRLTN